MQLLTLKNLDNFHFLSDEKAWLTKILNFLDKKWAKVYLIGSRLSGWWKDIDLLVKWWNITQDDLFKLKYLFWQYSDTDIDIVISSEKTKEFEKYLKMII